MDEAPPASAGETAIGLVLDALRWGWGAGYEFGADDEGLWALRRDGAGGKIRQDSLDALCAELMEDYGVKPVSRDFAPLETLQ